MTSDRHDAGPAIGCIDAEQIAAYVDGRVDPSTRRILEAHFAECGHCRAVLTETLAFVRKDPHHANTSFRNWPKFALASLVAAAAIGFMLIYVRQGRTVHSDRPELAELVAAAASEPTRLTEGRLTGGFSYKPPPVPTRGAADRNVSPELKIAAAKIEQTMRRQETAAADAALGTASLAVGDLDKAVEHLEAAVEQKPDDAYFQNDLSAAYIARATRTGRAEDWPKAYAAAERAAKRDTTLLEPCFNRALALEGLNLASDAADAWSTCAQADPASEWASEARRRAEEIRKRQSAPRQQSNQERREEIEDRLLVRWAEAETVGNVMEADGVLAAAEAPARDLAERGGDTMPVDEVELIRASAPDLRARTGLAKGHLAFGRAREAFLGDRLGDAAREMSAASESFAVAGSLYTHWASIYRAIPLWIDGSADAALRELSLIPLNRIPARYYHLKGRTAWTKAAAFETAGRFDLARNALDEARDLFRRAGELENESVNAAGLAEAEWFLGRRQQTWRNTLDALRHVDALPAGPRRSGILGTAAFLSSGEGLPETALAFQQHLVRLLESEHPTLNASDDASVYLRRGKTFGSLRDTKGALADFARAEAAASRIQEPRLREWTAADINAARSEVLKLADPLAAIAAADAALAFYRRTSAVIRVCELLLTRARAREARGDIDAAAADYEAAISALERDQDSVTAPQERKAAFDQQRTAVREAVRFMAVVRRDPAAALWIAERARARALRQRLGGPSARTVNPIVAYKQLPHNVAVLYYVTLPDRILAWVITADGSTTFNVPVDTAHLDLIVQRLRRRIANNASIAELSAEFHYLKSFVDPALSTIAPGATLVVVPDEGLAAVPFAALPDKSGAPLISTHPVLFAPSFTTFLLASQRLAGFEPDGVLAIGDGHDPSATGLPRLPLADAEATEVSRLYPHASLFTGSKATVRNFLAAREPVIHFGGHTIANAEFPFLSRLLFAPDSGRADQSGALLASDVITHRFETARVVVLASCESAAGRFIRGEGFDSVARMFLDAGVPSVVASLWPVDDDQSTLLIEFHRQLRITRDAVRALRAAQLKAIGTQTDQAPIRRWAGFLAIGGLSGLQFREDVGNG